MIRLAPALALTCAALPALAQSWKRDQQTDGTNTLFNEHGDVEGWNGNSFTTGI